MSLPSSKLRLTATRRPSGEMLKWKFAPLLCSGDLFFAIYREPVADARNRLYVPRRLGIVAQRLSNLGDGPGERVI
jgi:hypothetical protein